MSMKEKAAYLKGLVEGLNLDEAKPETKVITKLIEVIDDMAGEIESLTEDVDILNDYIEEIDEDLGEIEEIVYDIDDECDCCCDDDDCDCCCDDDCDCAGEFFCAMCPSCGEKIYFDESCDPEEVVCPSCQSPLISDEDEDEE